MAFADNPIIQKETVETLLRGRPAMPREECPEMAIVAQVLSGHGDEVMGEMVSDHLAQCAVCRDAVTMLCTMGETGESSVPVGKKESDSILDDLGRSRVRTLALAASILLVVGISILVLMQTGHSPSTETEVMQVKGDRDSFFVGVSRGPHRFSAEPFDKLAEGDRLGMFYTAEEAGYLMVVSLDESRTVSLLYPVGKQKSGPIRPGKEVSLNDGALVQAGSGCEWIVAAFSKAPISLADMTEILMSANVDDNCGLTVSIPAARTVRVLPFRR